MIFVTAGTEQYPFDRLMRWLDLLQQHQLLQDDIVVQYGNSTYLPEGSKVYKFVKEERFKALIYAADLVIAHCGEGTVLLLDSIKKPYILVPRTHAFGEHVDNHQIEMALALSEMDVPVAWSLGDIVRFVIEPKYYPISDISEQKAKAICQSLNQRFARKVPENIVSGGIAT
ncbi:MAG: glycosyltransferase [Thermosynechococcaceae cyanobacterium]